MPIVDTKNQDKRYPVTSRQIKSKVAKDIASNEVVFVK